MLTVYSRVGTDPIDNVIRSIALATCKCKLEGLPRDFCEFEPVTDSVCILHVDLAQRDSVDRTIERMQCINERQPSRCRVFLIAEGGSSEFAVEHQRRLLDARAVEIMERPISLSRLQSLLQSYADKVQIQSPRLSVSQQEIWRKLVKVANLETNVLLSGPTGVGKTYWAEQIHKNSKRSNEPFVVVNCANISMHLAESQLFGHVKGAFTGADREQPGQFDLAGKGTIFLDEVNSLSQDVQAKLLRAVEEREYSPVGASRVRPVEARIISATNQSLSSLVGDAQFRSDLFYRLNAYEICIPALKERSSEIIPMAELFLQQFATKNGLPLAKLSPSVIEALLRYDWPGNLRELRNAAEHGAIDCEEGEIKLVNLPAPIRNASSQPSPSSQPRPSTDDGPVSCLITALINNGYNRTQTARELGVSRMTVYNMLRRLGVG